MPEILAIIPSYQRPDQLDRCLSALRSSALPVEAFVHDNNLTNIGFTRACNLGLREALRRGHRYAMLLNQDCYVLPGTVGEAVAFMDAHPRCAILGVKQLQADDLDNIVHGGCTEAYPLGRHLVGKASNGDCTLSRAMPWVNGACVLIRLEAVTEIGLLDEGFFLIASDSDYCFTARSRGWEVWYCAEAVVHHESGGIASAQTSIEMMAHFNRDQLRFRDKWLGSAGWELLRQPPPPPGARATSAEIQEALGRAQQHYGRNELVVAELICRQILQVEPDHPDTLLVLGRAWTRSGFVALAAAELRKVIAAVPGSGPAHQSLADALVLSGFAEEASSHYLRARELGVRSPDLHNNLGVAFQRLGKRDEAIAEWHQALALDPTNTVAQKNLTDAGVTDLPKSNGLGSGTLGGTLGGTRASAVRGPAKR